jgi:hypothetical protein
MNPYEPPSATVSDPPAEPGSQVKAVFLGLLVDIGGTLLFGLAFGIVLAVALASRNLPADEIDAVYQATVELPWVKVALSAVGGCFSLLGGYVCARVSRGRSYRPGLIMAGISVVSGLAIGWNSYSATENALLAVLTGSSVLLGMRLGMPKGAA